MQVEAYRHPIGALDHLVAIKDAQAFVAIARDPLLRRVDVWIFGAPSAAFRYSRPLMGYLVWLLSFGQPTWAPYVLAVLGGLACAASIVLVAKLIDQWPRAWLAALLLVSPAYLAAIDVMGGDLLALALSLGGVLAWRKSKPWLAGLLFALAGLSHETYLLIPAVVIVCELVARHEREIRRLVPLVLSPIPYVVWIIAIHARVGAWPWDSGQDNLATPISGFGVGVSSWATLEVLALSFLVVVLGAAVVIGQRGLYLWIALAYTVVSLTFGWRIWKSWAGFSRVLLPIVVFGWLSVLLGKHVVARVRARSP